ncbi:MAG: alcohol dehydrogenase catalytic domain-containing protein [Acidobacteria bacterium]|nr:alcohol dehydrogenase catalytic domain-containing protein [Acidobacteriota bacterium]
MLAVKIETGKISVIETPKPRPRKGHALLRLRLAGICNTDIELLRGYYGFAGIPGHEFVADVVSAENPKLIGKRVVGEINLACGKCIYCQKGLGRHCPTRTVLGIVKHPGAFAEYLTLPEENLRLLPDSITDEEAVFTEPVAAACEILEQVRFPKQASVAVLGDGKLGLLIAQVLHLHGLKVELFGRNQNKLSLLQPMGIKATVIDRESPRLPRAAFPFVVDATGSAQGFDSALAMIEPRGTIIMKSTVAERLKVDSANWIVNEITLVGSRCGRFEPALKLLKSKRLLLAPMISGRERLADAPQAFLKAQAPGALKILLYPRT